MATATIERVRKAERPGKTQEWMMPLRDAWIGQVEQCFQARKDYDAVVKMIRQFFCGAIDFMWQDEFRNKYFGGKIRPRFTITLNRVAEIVLQYGPDLFWEAAKRVVKTEDSLKVAPQWFGDPNDPRVQEAFGLIQQEAGQTQMDAQARNACWDKYLNWTAREQPEGLTEHSLLCYTEAMITGRGVMWPQTWIEPSTGSRYTGCFFDNQDNLLIDPDAKHALIDAQYIIQRVFEPIWKVERDRDYPEGTLEGKGQFESHNAYGARSVADLFSLDKSRKGTRGDVMCYYKVWSKMGVGARINGVSSPLLKHLDKEAGDFCYLEISDSVDYPLNAPPWKIRKTESAEEVRELVGWPVPYWIDHKWPCGVIDFIPVPDSSYPMPPIAPGLGQLIYLNVFMSHLAGRTWTASRDFIACLDAAKNIVDPVIKKGEDLCIFYLPQIMADVDKIIKFIDQPNVNADAWEMLDRITHDFERAVGLTPEQYGVSGGSVERSAEASKGKLRQLGIRREHMRKQVVAHQTKLADLEKFCARMRVESSDVEPVLGIGKAGTFVWDKFVNMEPPELTVRNCRVTVEAQSMRRPNKEKDLENLNAVLPALLPQWTLYAQTTGNSEPLNGAMGLWFDALEMQGVEGLYLGPWQPAPPPPEVVERENQMAAAEQEAQQAETQGKLIDAQTKQQVAQATISGKLIDLQIKQAEIPIKGQMAQLDAMTKLAALTAEGQKHRQELAAKQQAHEFDTAAKLQQHVVDMDIQQDSAEQKIRNEAMVSRAKAKVAAQQKKSNKSKSSAGSSK